MDPEQAADNLHDLAEKNTTNKGMTVWSPAFASCRAFSIGSTLASIESMNDSVPALARWYSSSLRCPPV